MFFRMAYQSGQIFIPFYHNSRVWQTERQTDRILIARPRLHSMQRGKNGSVLWRRHRQLTYKQVTATHQSLTLSSNTASKDDRKSQGWNSVSIRPEGVNAKNVNEPVPLHFTYLHYVNTEADEWLSYQMMTTSHSSFSTSHGRLQPWLNSGR